MSDSLTFNFVRTTDDYWREVHACTIAEVSRWYVLASAGLLVAVLAYLALGLANSSISADVLVIVAVIIAVKTPFYGWLGYRFWHVLQKSAPTRDEATEGSANIESMSLSSPSDHSEWNWTDIVAAAERRDHFLFRAKTERGSLLSFYVYIPKRAFADSSVLGAFRDLVRAHVPNYRDRSQG